jgi:dihydrofolate reductase
MRKLKMHLHLSLDGYASDADGGFFWIAYSDELAARAEALTAGTDTVVFGPKTYKGMQSYWPTVPGNPDATPGEKRHADWLARSTKVVVSTSLPEADANWEKTLLLRDASALAELKQQPGGDLLSFGCPGLVSSCLRLGLVDEFHVFLNPIILGGSNSPFEGLAQTSLVLREAAPLAGGVIALCYTPAPQSP